MKQPRCAYWSAFLVFLLGAFPCADSIQAALPSENKPPTRELTQSSEQNKSSAALDEAAQLSRTVVKLFSEQKYDEALPLAKRALELRESALGSDHELVQAALLNLAELYTVMKKYGEAQKLVERLLKALEKSVGPDDPGAAILLDKLAFLAYVQRDFDKSEAAYKRALAIREKAYGLKHVEYAKSLFSLAEFYRFTGKPGKAQPLYEQSANLLSNLLRHDDPEYLMMRDRYFCIAFETHQESKLKDFAETVNQQGDPSRPDIMEGAVLNGKAISLPHPPYPEEARSRRVQGVVVVKVVVDETGSVIEASDMCGGNPLLIKACLEAARAARFAPTTLSGRPVKVSGVITYKFFIR